MLQISLPKYLRHYITHAKRLRLKCTVFIQFFSNPFVFLLIPVCKNCQIVLADTCANMSTREWAATAHIRLGDPDGANVSVATGSLGCLP